MSEMKGDCGVQAQERFNEGAIRCSLSVEFIVLVVKRTGAVAVENKVDTTTSITSTKNSLLSETKLSTPRAHRMPIPFSLRRCRTVHLEEWLLLRLSCSWPRSARHLVQRHAEASCNG